uniref:Acetyl-CoA carboxylase biotin carboxyl carrier protein subunit n=1 Tax=Archaeoglobus fulgidus TaxID=2234 RepID=A0A7C3MA16_ARCFL
MKYEVKVQGRKYEVEVKEISPMVFEVKVNGKKAVIEVEAKFEFKEFEKAEIREKRFVEERVRERAETRVKAGKTITAPMAGIVTKIFKKAGDKVRAGETVLIIEAMKMENPITSPEDGEIAEIAVNEGDKVGSGDVLVYLK